MIALPPGGGCRDAPALPPCCTSGCCRLVCPARECGADTSTSTFMGMLPGGNLDAARPFQRPDAGWVFQFSLAPGF